MTNKTIMLTLRLESALKAALDEKARQRRMATGENVAIADLVREALGQYLAPTDTVTVPTDGLPRYKAIRADAVRMRAEGMTQRAIAEQLGCAQSVVSKALKEG